MGAGEARSYWDHVGLMMLVSSLLLAPFAWLLDLQVSYSMVKRVCENDSRLALFLVPLGSLILIAVGSAMAWSCWTKLRESGRETGGRAIDRSYFLALTALALNAVFGLLIVTSLAPRYFLSPCE